jgi:hypothetical protein
MSDQASDAVMAHAVEGSPEDFSKIIREPLRWNMHQVVGQLLIKDFAPLSTQG